MKIAFVVCVIVILAMLMMFVVAVNDEKWGQASCFIGLAVIFYLLKNDAAKLIR